MARAENRETVVLAVRVPRELADAALGRCGGQGALSEWLRNQIRVACGRVLDKDVGYDEGYRAGWADANARFRAAVKSAGGLT